MSLSLPLSFASLLIGLAAYFAWSAIKRIKTYWPRDIAMHIPPRRRWFQFSLRTLFVLVTLWSGFLGWLVWEWRFVQQRLAVFSSIDANGIESDMWVWSVEHGKQHHGWWAPGSDHEKVWPEPTVPFWRVWLGDRAVAVFGVEDANEQKLAELQRLFPEAREFSLWPIDQQTPEPQP